MPDSEHRTKAKLALVGAYRRAQGIQEVGAGLTGVECLMYALFEITDELKEFRAELNTIGENVRTIRRQLQHNAGVDSDD